jgi:hypothetical protein
VPPCHSRVAGRGGRSVRVEDGVHWSRHGGQKVGCVVVWRADVEVQEEGENWYALSWDATRLIFVPSQERRITMRTLAILANHHSDQARLAKCPLDI